MKRYFTRHIVENKKGERFDAKLFRLDSGNDIKVELYSDDVKVKTIKLATLQSNYKIIEYNIGL